MILDNRGNGNVADTIKEYITDGSELKIITKKLSLFGYEVIKDELKPTHKFKLLCSLQGMFLKSFDDLPPLYGSVEERSLRNRLTGPYLAREMDVWLDKSAEVRITNNDLNTNYYQISGYNGNDLVMHGSSTLTSGGSVFL